MQVEINIPTGLNEITLKQYQEFVKVKNDNDDAQFIKQKLVSIMCRINLAVVASIRAKDFDDIVGAISRLFDLDCKLQTEIKIADKTFGFIPDLENMSLAEFVDLDETIKDWSTFNRAMAVLYRPITKQDKSKRYLIEEYNGSATYSEVMEHVTMDVVFGATAFFLTLGNECLNLLVDFLEKETSRKDFQTLASQHNLQNDGVGISQSISYLREILQNLMTLQGSHSLNL